jgi:prepilin-type N-terminal cleavage/methylation domain-containing protein
MKRYDKEKGFSLIELLVAVGILTVGMSAVGVMLLSSFQADRQNRTVRRAETLLRYFAEQFAAGTSKVTTGPSSFTAPPATGNAVIRGDTIVYDADTNPGNYYCSWTSTAYSTSSLNQLDVVIGWGRSKSSSAPCDRDHVDQCPFVMRMTNFY